MCTVDIEPVKGDFRMSNAADMLSRTGCANDKAKSMRICYAKQGTKVGVYAGKPNPSADGAEIYVDKDMGNKCETINKLEENNWYGDVKVDYISGNLDGRISSFDVTFENLSYSYISFVNTTMPS